jgi:rhodanese-related sulfurtransferase
MHASPSLRPSPLLFEVHMSNPSALSATALHSLREAEPALALFDVRDPMEADRDHIPGATPLPRRRLELRIGGLVRNRQTSIVVTDDNSGRAQLAANTLAQLGYTNVKWLEGGIAAWQAAGYRLATGNNVPSKLYGEVAYHEYAIADVEAEEFRQWQEEGRNIMLFDVRTPEEYVESCIPGSTSAPSFDIARHAGDLLKHNGPVVVHCAGRTRSLIAAQTLRELGVQQAVALRNGTMGWLLAGVDVERGAKRALGTPSGTSAAHAQKASRALADATGIARIEPSTLAQWLQDDDNLYVIDVRQRAEFSAAHIAGAEWVPGGQIIQRADDFIVVRNARIVLVDDDETRANLSAVWLRRMGFANASVLSGGMAAWQSAGYATATGRTRERPAGWDVVSHNVRVVSPEAAQSLIHTSGLLRIDVDTSVHYNAGHILGAHWIPRSWLERRIIDVVPDLGTPVLVSCGTGLQSVYAAYTLQELGYRTVYVLEGGTAAWQRAGHSLETAKLPPQDDILLPPYKRGEQAMRDYLAWEIELAEGKH